MKQIDLDDLPPRIAKTLRELAEGDALTLVQGGVVIAHLEVACRASAAAPTDSPAEAPMAEVLEQFSAMLHDEF